MSASTAAGSRVANLMMAEIIGRCSMGIDLHTGSDHRVNLPQVRGDLDVPEVRQLADAFGAPLMLHARTRDGSLREAATTAGAATLLFEGGEADRFDEWSIGTGTDGVLRAMQSVGMIDDAPARARPSRSSRSSAWVRASRSGIAHLDVALGDTVDEGDEIATIHDPFGKRLGTVRSRLAGMVIGHTRHPLVNRGDAIVHIADLEPLMT